MGTKVMFRTIFSIGWILILSYQAEYNCISKDKNHSLYYQLSTTYRMVKWPSERQKMNQTLIESDTSKGLAR